MNYNVHPITGFTNVSLSEEQAAMRKKSKKQQYVPSLESEKITKDDVKKIMEIYKSKSAFKIEIARTYKISLRRLNIIISENS